MRELLGALSEANTSDDVNEWVELSISDPQRYWRERGRSQLIEKPQDVEPFWVLLDVGTEQGLIGSVDWRAEPDEVFAELMRCSAGRFDEALTKTRRKIEAEDFASGASAIAVLRRCQHFLAETSARLLHLHVQWDTYEFFLCSTARAAALKPLRGHDYQVSPYFCEH